MIFRSISTFYKIIFKLRLNVRYQHANRALVIRIRGEDDKYRCLASDPDLNPYSFKLFIFSVVPFFAYLENAC